MPQFFFDSSHINSGGRVQLCARESKHLRAFRVSKGQQLNFFDASGNCYEARFEGEENALATIQITGLKAGQSDPRACLITLGQAVTSFQTIDSILKSASEQGIANFIPLTSQHAFNRSMRQLEERLERWQRVSMAAAKQCQRPWPTAISTPVDFEAFLSQAETFDLRVLATAQTARGTSMLKLRHTACELTRNNRAKATVLIAVGPEGGFTAQEESRLLDSGFLPLNIGPFILRSPTAALSACALVENEFAVAASSRD